MHISLPYTLLFDSFWQLHPAQLNLVLLEDTCRAVLFPNRVLIIHPPLTIPSFVQNTYWSKWVWPKKTPKLWLLFLYFTSTFGNLSLAGVWRLHKDTPIQLGLFFFSSYKNLDNSLTPLLWSIHPFSLSCTNMHAQRAWFELPQCIEKIKWWKEENSWYL